MRQFKFRVWDGKAFLTADDFCLFPEDNGNFLPRRIGEYGSLHDIERATVQQWTGLRDSEGENIYEGDIVKTDSNHFTALLQTTRESEEYTEYTKGEVRWWNEGFALCQENIGATRISEYGFCDCCPCGLTIIGNIFEGLKDSTV